MPTIEVVTVPTGSDLDLSQPCSPAWRTLHALMRDWHEEIHGHAKLFASDAETLRKEYTIANPIYFEQPLVLVLGADSPTTTVVESGLAFDDLPVERIVGYLTVTTAHTDPTEAFLDLFVAPEHRRQKIGTSALAFVRQQLAQRNIARNATWLAVPSPAGNAPVVRPRRGEGRIPADHPGVQFLLVNGFGLEMVEKSSNLDLSAGTDHFEQFLDYYKKFTGGDFSIEETTNSGFDWEEIRQIRNQFNADVPATEGSIPPQNTIESVQGLFAQRTAKGTSTAGVIIRHLPSGRPVAYTEITSNAGSRVGYQNVSWVERDFRGMKLAGLSKAANTVRIAREKSLDVIETKNPEDNHAMWAVNERLGFRVHSIEGAWVSEYREGKWQSPA